MRLLGRKHNPEGPETSEQKLRRKYSASEAKKRWQIEQAFQKELKKLLAAKTEVNLAHRLAQARVDREQPRYETFNQWLRRQNSKLAEAVKAARN